MARNYNPKRNLRKNENRVYDPQYAKFRKTVRARDGHKCVWPQCTEHRYGELVVHHIRGWAKFPNLRYDPDNGVTLCKKHHALTIGNEENYLALFMQIVRKNKHG